LIGYDFALEGIACVEFAQCGLAPLVKTARKLGIEWFLLADGDAAGKAYIESAKKFIREQGGEEKDHCMRFREKDIEQHLFYNGYADVFFKYAGLNTKTGQNLSASRVISRAINRNSKPYMAVAVVEAIARNNSPGIPSTLKKVVETCVRLSRGSVEFFNS
jgi:putative ATP-dependent endonuclease of OLD family